MYLLSLFILSTYYHSTAGVASEYTLIRKFKNEFLNGDGQKISLQYLFWITQEACWLICFQLILYVQFHPVKNIPKIESVLIPLSHASMILDWRERSPLQLNSFHSSHRPPDLFSLQTPHLET